MARAILHVGYPKTASTWFQRHFYPEVSSVRYIPQKVVQQAMQANAGEAFDPPASRALLADGDDGRPIAVCKEGLVGHPTRGGRWGGLTPSEIADRLARVFDEPDIIVLIRNQLSALASLYLQYIRRGGSLPPRAYFHSAQDTPDFGAVALGLNLAHMDYNAVISCFERRFGCERVHVFLYEDFDAAPTAFLDALASRLDLGGTPPAPIAQRVNRAYGRRALTLARLFNRLGRGRITQQGAHLPVIPHPMRQGILNALAHPAISGRAPSLADLIGKHEADAIAARFAASNADLALRHGLDLSRHGYPGAGTPPTTPATAVQCDFGR